MRDFGQLCLAIALLAPGCSSSPETAEITPVKVEIPGGGADLWQTVNFYVSGQPNAQGLLAARARGVRTVVNLRPAEEMAGFDEKKSVEALGLAYVSIPVTLQTLTDDTVDKFIAALKSAKKQVLIHCASGNRASALWAAYLSVNYGLPPERAIVIAERSGLEGDDLKAFVRDYLARRKGMAPEGETQKS